MADGKQKDRRSSLMPQPPHPLERQQSVPAHQPKPTADTAALSAQQAILDSRSYRTADEDIDFLQSNGTRGVRLQLDYLKTETLLRAHNVAHTIVVFGGTRIAEPEVVQRDLERLTAESAANPSDDPLRRRLTVAERLHRNSRYYDVARELGRIVGTKGRNALDGEIMVMTGGGPGIMEAANRGACDVGAKSIGLNIGLARQQSPNPYVTPELCFQFHYFAIRKLHFLMRARALVAFPGGYGTLDEIFEVLSLAQTRKMSPVPVILVGENYWRRVFDAEFLVDEGVIDPEDRDLFWFAETADQIWRDILSWYESSGRPLLPPSERISQEQGGDS